MWITTCHAFTSRAKFFVACLAASWTCPPRQDPMPHIGVALGIVGPVVAPAQVVDGGGVIPGYVLDPCYHVNLT